MRRVHRSRVVLFVWGAAVALAFAAAAAELVDFAATGRVARALDLDHHASVFGVVSLLALAVACAAAGVFALLTPDRRREFGVLSALLAVLLALRVFYPAHVLAFSIPPVAAVFVVLWRHTPEGPARQLHRGACIVLAVAFAAHAVDHWLLTGSSCACDPRRWGERIVSVIKHATELGGWVVAAGGFIPLLRASEQQGGLRYAPGDQSGRSHRDRGDRERRVPEQ